MTYEEGFAAGMRRAAEECAHEEQVRIWAHDIIEGLGFADVLKISSYDDNIAAHDVVEQGVYRVCQSLTDAILAAIPPTAPWTPPPEAERSDGFECLGQVGVELLRVKWNPYTHWNTANDTYHGWFTVRDSVKVRPTAFAPLPPSPEDAP